MDVGDPSPFAAEIRRWRRQAALSQEELAERAGLATRTVRQLELGAVRQPHPRTVRALVDALGLTGPTRLGFIALAAGSARSTHGESPREPGSPPWGVPLEVPSDIGDFTGRQREIDAITRGLQPSGAAVPVVVVTGAPGVGKTALVVHVAHRLRGNHPDGILFAELTGISRPEDAASHMGRFLRVLGVPQADLPAGMAERELLLRTVLASRRVLLVLDDAATASIVRSFLPSDPSVGVLVTSRHRLSGLGDPCLVDVNVPAEPEAVDLLARILGRDRVEAHPETARVIVERCGYLPLAVRVAGARAVANPHWSLERLAELLAPERRRLDELQVDGLAVRPSIALGYHELDQTARRLAARLALLDVPDVAAWVPEALCDAPRDQAEDALDELIRTHLLEGRRTGNEVRYRFHVLVRAYLRAAVSEREFGGSGDTPAPTPVLEDEPSTAMCTLIGGWLWLMSRHGSQLHGRLSGLTPDPDLVQSLGNAAVPAEQDAWLRAELPGMVSLIRQASALDLHRPAWNLSATLQGALDWLGEVEAWETTHAAALSSCERAGDVRGEAHMHNGLAVLELRRARYRTALVEAREAQRLFRLLGDARWAARAQAEAGAALRQLGDLAAARDDFAAAVVALRQTCDGIALAHALDGLGSLLVDQGQPEQAVPYLAESLAVVRAEADASGEALALRTLAVAYRNMGDLDRAAAHFEQAGSSFRTTGNVLYEALCRQGLAEVRLLQGRLEEARDEAETALRTGEELSLPRVVGLSRRTLGRVALLSHRPADALAALERALTVWEEVNAQTWIARTLVDLGRARLALGEVEAAAADWRRAAAVFAHLDSEELAEVQGLLRSLVAI